MDEKERNQFVDDLLEASLARYSSVPPRPGLEGRVLANVRAAQGRHAWFVWAGWLAAGAAAVLIVIGALSLTHRVIIPSPPQRVEVTKSTSTSILAKAPTLHPPERSLVPRRTSSGRTVHPTLMVAHAEARLPEFPSPSPLTSEEKLLVQYVRATPAPALLASSTGTTKIQEIQIKELEISPLDDESADSKNNQ